MASKIIMGKEFKNSKYFYQDTLIPSKNSSDTVSHINTPKHQAFSNETKPIKANEALGINKIIDSVNLIPEFVEINRNNKTLINNYKENVVFNSSKDNNCYFVNNKNTNKNISKHFIETNGNKTHIETDYIIKERTIKSEDWVIIPIFIGLFLLVSIIVRYSKYLGVLFESLVYRFSSNKNLNEKNKQFKRLTIFLDILFVISFALAVDQIVKGLKVYIPPQKFQFIIFLAISALVITLRVFQLIVFKLTSVISDQKIFFKELFNISSLYTRTLGVFLLPMVFFITYSSGLLNSLFIYLSILITLIMLIIRIINIFRAFIVRGFSIFYFILYLCALEIAPLLIIWKEVKSR